ncbi:MAG: hypothetical protein IKI22_00440 [Neisseriaceae bacterium]|nr:hypothetical protein [Neisseriaceae bacterium]
MTSAGVSVWYTFLYNICVVFLIKYIEIQKVIFAMFGLEWIFMQQV